MKKSGLYLSATLLFLLSCTSKKKEPEVKFISAISIIAEEIGRVDSSLSSIIRYDFIDSTRTDTTFIHRDDFRRAAEDFINLPDISSDKLKHFYTEEKLFDEQLNTVIYTYLLNPGEKQPITRQELLITPTLGDNRVKSIFIDYYLETRDSSIQKKLLWQNERSFQVTTIRQYLGQPEKVSTTKVTWNEANIQ